MDFKEIQEILKKEGGKIIIVENDRPQLVVMSFEEYKGKVLGGRQGELERAPLPREPEEGELTIDDLPL
jgi:hypothetical protein